MRLTERRERFIREYVRTGNASESARLAGYSKDTAGEQGCFLLKNISIRNRIDEELKAYDLSKEQYIAQTIERAKDCKQEAIQKGYWEIVGKCKGFFQENNTNLLILNNLDTDSISKRALERIKGKDKVLKVDDKS